jgi:hypothetical protein
LILSLPESVAKIVCRMALLPGERTGLSVAKHVGKMDKPSFDLTAVELAMRKRHQVLVIRPLITDQ